MIEQTSNADNNINVLRVRHCERSEAIRTHRFILWIASLFASNDAILN